MPATDRFVVYVVLPRVERHPLLVDRTDGHLWAIRRDLQILVAAQSNNMVCVQLAAKDGDMAMSRVLGGIVGEYNNIARYWDGDLRAPATEKSLRAFNISGSIAARAFQSPTQADSAPLRAIC